MGIILRIKFIEKKGLKAYEKKFFKLYYIFCFSLQEEFYRKLHNFI